MERTEYRRSSLRDSARKSRSYSGTDESDNSEMLETVLTQCIISGVVLLVILLMCLVKTEFTQNIRMSLKSAIAGETNLEHLKTVFNIPFVSAPEDDAPSSVDIAPTIDETEKHSNTGTYDAANIATYNPDDTTTADEAGDFRIDEDILAEINSKTDPYGDNLKK